MDPNPPPPDEQRDEVGRYRPGFCGNVKGRPRRTADDAALVAVITRARAAGGRVAVIFDPPKAA